MQLTNPEEYFNSQIIIAGTIKLLHVEEKMLWSAAGHASVDKPMLSKE
tara:strand:+ start:1563 stop:1706 length:144 start_codon:yes stop_codon:yes gene_type:complete